VHFPLLYLLKAEGLYDEGGKGKMPKDVFPLEHILVIWLIALWLSSFLMERYLQLTEHLFSTFMLIKDCWYIIPAFFILC